MWCRQKESTDTSSLSTLSPKIREIYSNSIRNTWCCTSLFWFCQKIFAGLQPECKGDASVRPRSWNLNNPRSRWNPDLLMMATSSRCFRTNTEDVVTMSLRDNERPSVFCGGTDSGKCSPASPAHQYAFNTLSSPSSPRSDSIKCCLLQ